MIERWEIRENTITSNPEAIYLLLMIGTDEYAGYVAKGLSSFARLVSVRVPPFSHVFELYNIVDDSVLEKIRIKMEELSQYVGVEGDINERTKHVDLDVISPETEIFGDAGNNMQQEPAVFMEEPDMPSEDNHGRRQTFSIKPETDSRQQLREDPFVANQKNERKVMSSEIFSDTQPSTGKVHLSGGDFSVHKDSSSLETFDVEDGTSIDVGDGTFINLNGAEGTQLKRFEDTDLNVQSEDSMPSGVGIATLIGGKYHDEEPDQSSNSLPSLRLMGGLANDANQAQRELIKDPYKPAPAPEPVHPVRNVSDRISNQNQYMPSVDNSVKQKGNIAKEEIPNQTINNNKASAQKRVPDNKSGHKSGGFLGGFFSKIMNKFSSEKKKEEPAPLAFTNSRPETKDFNQLLQEEQTKQTEQASLQAKTEENNVPVATEQKTPEQPNPFANLGAPKKDEFATDVPKKPAVNNFHSISAGGASSPLELDNNVPEELSAKIEVDDIFAAETLCEFYADEEDTSTNNVDRILGVSSPAQPQQNKKADLSKQPLGGEDNLLDVPENIFSTPSKEKANPKNDSLDSAQNQATKPAVPNKETEKEPAMKVSSGQRVSNPVNLKPSVMQTPKQAEIKRPVSSPKPVSVPKPVPQKTATTPVPAAPVKSAFGRVNIKEILAQSKAVEYGKDKLKDAIADKIDNADPIGMLKAGFMPKKSAAAPKQETETNKASLKDAVMQGAVDYGKDKLKDAIADKIDNADPIGMLKAGFMPKKSAAPKQETETNKASLKDAVMQGAVEYGKDKLKDAIADKIDNADPIGMLKAGFMPKKSAAAPKQETETNKASLKDAVMQGAVDYGKDKLKDAIADKIDNADPIGMLKAGFMPKKSAAAPKQETETNKASLKDAVMQGAVEYGKDKLKDAIADKIDNADPIGMLKAGFMPKKSAAAPKQETEPKQASEPKKTISESKPAVIGLKQTVVAKPVVPSKPVIPVKNIPISKPAIAGVSKTVALNKPKINTNASFKPVQNNLNNSGNINRADAKKDFNKNTEQINKGEKRVIMTQDSSNNFNKPVRPNIPVAPKKPLGPKPAVPAAPKIPSTPRPPIPGVRPSVPVKRPVSQPNIAKPAPQVRPQNPARPQVPAGGHTPSVRPQVPLNPAQNVAATKPAPKPAPEPRAATSIDHTILISAGQIYKRNNWPLEIPLNPLFTFDNMDMASNRFAHATAMSVIDNIGNMHNPFMLYGESGTGKSHFLNAMGYEISKKIGQEKIFLTNGVRLSRGVQRYVEENKVAQLEEFFSSVEVLIIDDIHLTAVNEHNRDFISRLLNRFLQEHKQMIISSKYPPESLARFEELVRFRLDQGWVSELKPPRQMHFSKIYKRMFEEADLGLNEEQQQQYLGNGNVNKTDLSLIARDIKRVQVLSRRINNSGLIQMTYDQILNEMLALDGENPDSEILRKNFADITSINKTENTEWGNFGFFYPQDQADKFKWMAYCVMQKAREMGIKGGFNFALKSGYSTDHIISAAFKIANICDTRNLKGAIILGPDLTVCQKSIRDNFYDILMHMLEVMMIRCGIIDAENIKMPSAYVRVLGDVLK